MRYNSHPLMAFSYMKRFFFILILPLLRAFLDYGAPAVLSGVLLTELVIFIMLTVYSVMKQRCCYISLTEKSLVFSSGIIFKKTISVELMQISGIYVERKPFL